MRRFVSSLVFVALIPSAAPAAVGISVLETHAVSPEPWTGTIAPTHRLRLHLYAFAGTRWRPDDIGAAVRQAMPLLSQCGVALAGSELKLIEAPREFHFYSTSVSARLLRAMKVPRPAVFFVEDTRNEPAFDAEAIGRANSTMRPELADTVWIAHGARDLPLALAHELVHLLADSGEHSDEPGNLMLPETSPANTRLSAGQCERLRARGTANGLLEPQPPLLKPAPPPGPRTHGRPEYHLWRMFAARRVRNNRA
jgi:hypothetical protein